MNAIRVQAVGRREANKREKLSRIRQAAKKVFSERGFLAATIREISVEADVALGTLFLYAKDKQDLLLLIFEEDLPAVRETAYANARADIPFLDQLIAYFEPIYRYFFATPSLSKDMLREVTFSTGIVAQRIGEDLAQYEHYLARIVARAQAAGDISPSIRPDLAAHTLFNLHRIEIRICFGVPNPDIQQSLNNLRQQFELVFNGLRYQR
jgi:AcrR family transcriptional regulator